MRYTGFGQTSCTAQQQELGLAQAAQAQALTMQAFDGGQSLAAANQRLSTATQALQSCQGGSSAADNIKAAGAIVAPLASLGTGIASLFMKQPKIQTPAPQTYVQPSNNNTVIIAAVIGVILLVVVVLMMGKK